MEPMLIQVKAAVKQLFVIQFLMEKESICKYAKRCFPIFLQFLSSRIGGEESQVKDERGKANSVRKFTENTFQQIVAHINEFPREKSNYSREK